jgi:ankyrin repeat domain-containing protein 50
MADEEQMYKVLAQEADVLKIAKLTDTNKLLYLEAAVTRLSVQATMYSQSLSEEKYNKILEWLSAPPYYNHHQFVSQSRLPGLGKWLLSHKDYIDWQFFLPALAPWYHRLGQIDAVVYDRGLFIVYR